MKPIFIITLYLWSSVTYGQWYRSFDLEVAINYSRVYNRGTFVTEGYNTGFYQQVFVQSNSSQTNPYASLGIAIHNNHKLRLSYGSKNIGVKIDGTISWSYHGSEYEFNNFSYNVKQSFWSLGYEYSIPVSYRSRLLTSVDVARQSFGKQDLLFTFSGLAPINYSTAISAGYQYDVVGGLSVIGRGTFRYFLRSDGDYISKPESEFLPLLSGLELGLRWDFKDHKLNSEYEAIPNESIRL